MRYDDAHEEANHARSEAESMAKALPKIDFTSALVVFMVDTSTRDPLLYHATTRRDDCQLYQTSFAGGPERKRASQARA